MITLSLEGRIILVTGALGAIAMHVNRRLIEAGATLVLTDVIAEAEASRCLDELGKSRTSYCRMDVTDQQEVTRVVSRLLEEHPGLDSVIGLAGGCGMHPFDATTEEEYERIFRFNYFGQVNVCRAVLKEWTSRSTRGHFLFTTSLVAQLPWVDLSAYIPAKAAVEALMKCLALEYARHGIRFNTVAPGHVAAGSSLKVYESDQTYRDMVDRIIPLKRLIKPESIADAFLWLCSDLALDVNGQVIKVDCGTSLPKVG